MLSPVQFEAAAMRLVEDMNRKYFGGAARVVGVRLAKFDKRGSERIALGMYDTQSNMMYLNYHLRYVMDGRPQYNRSYMSVVWHELCHAMLTTALMPVRLKMYSVCDHHGPEFMELYNKRKYNASDEEMEKLFQAVGTRQHLMQSN